MSNAQILAEIRSLYQLLHDVNLRLKVLERNEQPLSAQIPPSGGLINQLLRHDGSAPDWAAFDWDVASAAAGADMAHSHQSAAEGAQIALAALSDHSKANHDALGLDHGALSGLADDDHSQYLNTTRHDTPARHGSGVVDHGSIGGLGDDDHAQYLLASGARTGAISQDQTFTNTVRVVGGGIYLGRDADPGVGAVGYADTLISYKNFAEYDVFAVRHITSPLTSTSWDGDAKSATNYDLDVSAVFGAPANTKHALLVIGARWSSISGSSYAIGLPYGSAAFGCIVARGQVANQTADGQGLCPGDSNGDIRITIGAATSSTYVYLWGYTI